ncbi:hypothetical protein PHMEG_00018742 [Phytophthora megakarya]|uniref:Uncharacterized protein n=1 Tax=Phytophthora megakarya TaxID=4795 RepID=A0A225VTB3_9STRA|nr:hypothetical protein PHMEG_00018742 [Phytophthora megakarya]
MDGYDWVKLRREVYEIRENTLNPRSRTTYLNSYSRFIGWVALSKQHYVPAAFIEEIGGAEATQNSNFALVLKEKIALDRTTPLLDFAYLQAQDFVTWLATLKRRDCGLLSYSALNTHRAVLFNLYRDFELTMTKTLESELANHFKGLKNKLAKDMGNGIRDVKTEKTRWTKVVNALVIRVTHAPILMEQTYYFLVTTSTSAFASHLRRILAQDDFVAELSCQGLKATELGPHSMWKDAATLCSSGSTACLSSTAVHLRAGRSLGGVQNTYLRYEAAGDMHVRRTIAGLPTESSQFSILAPHLENLEKCVINGVRLMFPGTPERLEFVAEYCLVSLVYHYYYPKEKLPPEHQLFQTPLFQYPELQFQLFERVKTGETGDANEKFSNSPNWNTSLKQRLVEALSRIESTRFENVKDIIGEQEARAIGAGTVMYDVLHDAIIPCLQETGVDNLLLRLTIPVQQTPDAISDNQDNEHMLANFWGGQFRGIPTDFQVPDCSTGQAWILWRCGNGVMQ